MKKGFHLEEFFAKFFFRYNEIDLSCDGVFFFVGKTIVTIKIVFLENGDCFKIYCEI